MSNSFGRADKRARSGVRHIEIMIIGTHAIPNPPGVERVREVLAGSRVDESVFDIGVRRDREGVGP
jgi:hypothetical protein